MKKFLLAVVCVIILCSLLTVPLSLRLASSTSPNPVTPQSTPQIGLPPTTQAGPDGTPQNTLPTTIPLQPPANPPQSSQQPNPQPTLPAVERPTNRSLQEAVGKATDYIAGIQELYALVWLNVLYRRFGITEFADSLDRYDAILATNPENAPLLRIFRRIAAYDNPLQPMDYTAVTADVDKITVPALYSDRDTLPENYMQQLNDEARSGGYLLTHTLLATIWLHDNNCDAPIDFTEFVYQANAAIVGSGPVVTDLQLEAAAFLYVAGQGKLVEDTFVQSVVAAQNYDGGWSYSSDSTEASNWHTSVLGLMLLLHVEFPAASYPPILAPAPSLNRAYLNPLILCAITVWLSAFAAVRKRNHAIKQLVFMH
jgi:hypothetical protein